MARLALSGSDPLATHQAVLDGIVLNRAAAETAVDLADERAAAAAVSEAVAAAAALAVSGGPYLDVYANEAALLADTPAAGDYLDAETGNRWRYASGWTFVRNDLTTPASSWAALAARHGSAGMSLVALGAQGGAVTYATGFAAAQSAYPRLGAVTEAEAKTLGLAQDEAGGGLWVREWRSGPYEIRWSGATDDSATDRRALLNLVAEFVSQSGGGTVDFGDPSAPSAYFAVSGPVYWRSGVGAIGTAEIRNTFASATRSGQPVLFGNLHPAHISNGWLTTYELDAIADGDQTVTFVTPADSDAFAAGDLVWVYNANGSAVNRAHVQYLTKVQSVGGGTMTLVDSLPEGIASAGSDQPRITRMTYDADVELEADGVLNWPIYAIENVRWVGPKLSSDNWSAFSRAGFYRSHAEFSCDVARSAIETNGLAHSFVKATGTFGVDAIEVADASWSSEVVLDLSYVDSGATLTEACVSLNLCRGITLRGIVHADQHDAPYAVQLGNCSECDVTGLTVHARAVTTALLRLVTAGVPVARNRIRGCEFYGGAPTYAIWAEDNGNVFSQEDLVISDSRFWGSFTWAVDVDGPTAFTSGALRGVEIESGAIGDSVPLYMDVDVWIGGTPVRLARRIDHADTTPDVYHSPIEARDADLTTITALGGAVTGGDGSEIVFIDRLGTKTFADSATLRINGGGHVLHPGRRHIFAQLGGIWTERSRTEVVAPYVQDTFTGSDATNIEAHTPDADVAAGGWDDVTGSTFSLLGNKLTASAASRYAVIDTPSSDYILRCTMTPEAAAPIGPELVFRYQNTSNLWMARVRNDNSTLQIIKREAAVETISASMLVSTDHTLDDTYTLVVRCVGNRIELFYLDHRLTVTSSFSATETHVGVRSDSALGDRFEDFNCHPLA